MGDLIFQIIRLKRNFKKISLNSEEKKKEGGKMKRIKKRSGDKEKLHACSPLRGGK